MSEPDARPRPQYGEYASAEEQRARIAQPEVTDALETGQAPEAAAPGRRAGSPVAGWRLADRIVAIALLAYGVVNVAVTAPRLFYFAGFANDYFSMMGVDATFTNDGAAAVWGPVAAISYVAGFVATAVVTWRRLRSGRIAFWVPIVGAVLTTIVVAVCITVPLSGDPAFLDAVRKISGGS
ncbi:DUF6264 family protein [Microbacterium sp. NPDC091313]